MKKPDEINLPKKEWQETLARAREAVGESPGSHGWDHVRRVFDLCLLLGRKEKADLTVLALAALLHDIGRKEESASKGGVCHAQIGARKAVEILGGLNIPEAIREKVRDCIRSHRFRGSHLPATLEARILFDADKLDSIGAVGLGRAFLFAGEVGARLHNYHKDLSRTVSYSWEDTAYREFQVKLRRVRERMLTPAGRTLAEGRHRFMERFFARLEAEIKGLK
ncbi:MAG: HD domain-containing protein [Deltaproteobacteria bacterium]|nr:HD domain-containing protein [Deltaproteobacteria bacterium]